MQLNNHPQKQDLVSAIDFLLKTDEYSYPIEDKVRNINAYLQKAVALIHEVDNNWLYDDKSHPDLPFATTNIITNQYKYQLPNNLLSILKVEIKQGSTYQELTRKEEPTIPSTSGTPNSYSVVDEYIILDPIPNQDITDGLRITYKREAINFTTTDDTKEPPLPEWLQYYLVYGAAIEYAKFYKPELINILQYQLQDMENQLKIHYARRDQDHKKRWTFATDNLK